jgi:phosphopantetheinyl transferase
MPLIHHRSFITESILVWEILESESDLWQMLGACDALENALKDLKHAQRRLERLATYVLIKTHFNALQAVSYNADGKPVLANGQFISISHSGPFVGIIISRTHAVAMDIEQIESLKASESSRISRIAQKFLNPAEQAFISAYSSVEQVWMQTVVWSAKEVLFKLYSKGGVDFKEHLHIRPFTPGPFTMLDSHITKPDFKAAFRLHVEHHQRWMMVFGCINERIN